MPACGNIHIGRENPILGHRGMSQKATGDVYSEPPVSYPKRVHIHARAPLCAKPHINVDRIAHRAGKIRTQEIDDWSPEYFRTPGLTSVGSSLVTCLLLRGEEGPLRPGKTGEC